MSVAGSHLKVIETKKISVNTTKFRLFITYRIANSIINILVIL